MSTKEQPRQPRFTPGETRVIDGISYIAVKMTYYAATEVMGHIDKRTGVHEEADPACSRCFIYAADRTAWHECQTQCETGADGDFYIARTEDLPLLALEGLL